MKNENGSELNLDDSLTDQQLQKLSKLVAPKNLAPVEMGLNKKNP